jgi:hypothetical protein
MALGAVVPPTTLDIASNTGTNFYAAPGGDVMAPILEKGAGRGNRPQSAPKYDGYRRNLRSAKLNQNLKIRMSREGLGG